MSPTKNQSGDQFVVSIPADVERPDKILTGLTAHQVVIFTVTGLAVWLGYLAVGRVLPLQVFAAMAVVVVAAGALLALGGRDGVSMDRWLLAGLHYACSPRHRVLAPEGIPDPPGWADLPRPAPVPLDLPVAAISADGVVDLGADGIAVIAEASTVSFSLRTPSEQHALVVAFARWLNSLGAGVQILVRAERVDLAPIVAGIEETAPTLPHPALEQAAREHAAFLAQLNVDNDLLRRQVLLVFTEPDAGRNRTLAVERVQQRLEGTARALAAADITVTPLDGGQVAAVLAAATDPLAPPRVLDGWAAPDQVITGGGP
jgi:hypothetical protein